MSAEPAKNLKYFLEHPDEMPEDPKEIERLSREHMSDAMAGGTEQINVDTIVGKADEKPAESSPAAEEAKPAQTPAAEVKAEAKPADGKPAEEAKPEGILAKDGKNIIPYSQLTSARDRATAAEGLAKELQAKLDAATAAKAAPADAPNAEMLTEEELEVLEADSPTLAKTLRAQQAAIRSLTEQVKSVVDRQVEQVATEEGAIKTEIQTAIDGNPTLAGWQAAEDQTLWVEASKFDKILRENPKYADVPFADRFAKVVELTQEALGLEAETPTVVKEEKPALKPDEVRAAAAAKLAAAGKKAVPTSLSQIPGGAPPAVDEKAKLEDMSPVALGQMFLGMTAEQRAAYLESL